MQKAILLHEAHARRVYSKCTTRLHVVALHKCALQGSTNFQLTVHVSRLTWMRTAWINYPTMFTFVGGVSRLGIPASSLPIFSGSRF